MRYSRFGLPLRVNPAASTRSVQVVEPTLGLIRTQPPSDLPPGATPSAENFIVRYGGLEKRAMLQSRTTQATVVNTPVLGGIEAVDVLGNTYPLASYNTRPLWYSVGSWSLASYVSAAGLDDHPTNSTSSYWDMTQIYFDTRDENVVVMGSQSYQSLYVWQSNTTVFSTLTNAPRARFVASFDNFLLAANVREGSNDFVQRIQWSDRGSITTWNPVGSLAGFHDMLDSKGEITRLVPQDNRIVVFTEEEVWSGWRIDNVFQFDFQALDRGVGAPYSWTIAQTRAGVMWLGRDANVYVLPKGEARAVPVGDAIQPELQSSLDNPDRAWAVYNKLTDQYELYYPTAGNTYPTKALYLDLRKGSWMPQTFDSGYGLSRGWQGTLGTGSGSTTWAQAQAAGIRWADITGTWAGQRGQQNLGPLAVHTGSSAGTMYYMSHSATSDSGVTVAARWRSGGLGGNEPYRSKTLTEVRVDYAADSASSLTVRASADQGASFQPGINLELGTSSTESQQVADAYVNARYPVFEVVSEVGRPKINRFWAEMRAQGR